MPALTIHNLPLELLRPIISFAVVGQDTLREVLELRLVSSIWDTEVLCTLAIQHVLLRRTYGTEVWTRTPWYQQRDYSRRGDSIAEFWTSYILANPYRSNPWDRNLATLLIRVVDEVMTRQGGPSDLSTTRRYLRILVDEAIVQLGTPKYRYRHKGLQPRHGLEELFLSGRETRIVDQPLEGCVLTAQILVGHLDPCLRAVRSGAWNWKSAGARQCEKPFGTILHAAVRSGSCELVRGVLGVAANAAYVSSGHHRLLQAAVATGDLEIVKLVMEPPGYEPHCPSGMAFEQGVVDAIVGGNGEIIRYLLSKASCDRDLLFLVHEGIRAASRAGDDDTLAWLLDHEKKRNLEWVLDCCATPLEIAVHAGHLSCMRILLDHGVEPKGKPTYRGPRTPEESATRSYPHHHYGTVHTNGRPWMSRTLGALFSAAVKGRVAAAEMLLAAGLELDEDLVVLPMLAAVELGRMDFFAWIIDKLPRWRGGKGHMSPTGGDYICEKPDLLGHVCVWGTPEMLRMLVKHGYSIHGTVFAEGDEYDNIVLATLNWSRPDMHQALLDLGAPPADPYESSFKGLWKLGSFPAKAKTRLT